MGEGMVGLVASDNTVIGAAGYSDWSGDTILPWSGILTENAASSLGTGVTSNTYFPTSAYRTVSGNDATNWTIVYDGSSLKFYDDNGFFAQSSVSSPVAKLSIIGGAYQFFPYADYVQFNGLFVHKYASATPSVTFGSEQTSSRDQFFGGVSGTWVWSNFTWSDSAVLPGTSVAWKISYVDTSGNSVTTDQMEFTITDGYIYVAGFYCWQWICFFE